MIFLFFANDDQYYQFFISPRQLITLLEIGGRINVAKSNARSEVQVLRLSLVFNGLRRACFRENKIVVLSRLWLIGLAQVLNGKNVKIRTR